jgi:hypothetical protein
MKKIFLVLLPIALLFIAGCVTDSSSSENGSGTTDSGDTTSIETPDSDNPTTYTNKDCPVQGTFLTGNKLVLPEKQTIAYIIADSTTRDEQFGDSHRKLVVFDSESCEAKGNVTLPVNNSPDFPYYLARINYNNSSNLLGIRGFEKIFCYDLLNNKLLPELTPSYKAERYGEDAQSGMILRIEVWEQFLIGYARDEGAFAFDLRDPAAPVNVLPFAEYEINETTFASLFLFPSSDGGTQCLMPKFDIEKDEFSINPLLEKPAEIDNNVPASATNNRYLVLKLKDDQKTPLAFDLQNYQKVDLPQEVAAKPVQEIIEWMKER